MMLVCSGKSHYSTRVTEQGLMRGTWALTKSILGLIRSLVLVTQAQFSLSGVTFFGYTHWPLKCKVSHWNLRLLVF